MSKTKKTNAKKTPKPFQCILKDSPTHSIEHVTQSIIEASIAGGTFVYTHDQARDLALQLHLKGTTPIIKGSREICRKAARAIKARGEDAEALRLTGMKGQGPIPTVIKR